MRCIHASLALAVAGCTPFAFSPPTRLISQETTEVIRAEHTAIGAQATFVGGPPCPARVERARRLHGTLEAHDRENRREATFLALSYSGCPEAAYGVVGAEVTRHAIEPDRLPPASRALARLIARRDAEAAGDIVDEAIHPPRAFVLPSANLAIVVGHARWVVRDGSVVQNGYGRPIAVVEAGPLTLIELDSPSEGWLAALEDFERWPESSSH